MRFKKILVFLGLGTYLFFLFNPFAIAIPHFFFVNVTESLPRGIYLAIPGMAIRNGDIVAFQEEDRVMETIYKNHWIPEGENPAFLKFAAMEGSTYSVDPKDLTFRVNGEIIGIAHTTDPKGHMLTPQVGEHIVEKGRFLPYTPADRSYDGRYTGTIARDRIYSRIIPLIVMGRR